MKHLVTILILSFTTLINAQNIGLNTETPDENIHMIGDLRVDNYDSGDIILRLYKDKQAFRTGKLTASFFESDSIGIGSFGSGEEVIALGKSSAVFGWKNRVLGNYSISYGVNNEVLGAFSFAGGGDHTIYGNYNTAFGYTHHITGFYNLIGGYNNDNSGSTSTVFGAANSSTSDICFTSGQGLIANSFSSIFLGSYNTEYANTSKYSWSVNDPLLVIGNGSSSSMRNNAMVIMKNGKVGIDTDQPTEQLEVNGNIKTSGNFIGDGSLLTNLQDGHWQTTQGYVFNNSDNIGIGLNSPDHNLAIGGNQGMLIRNSNPDFYYRGSEIEIISPNKTPYTPSFRTGQLINLVTTSGPNNGLVINVESDDTNTYNHYGIYSRAISQGNLNISVYGASSGTANKNYGAFFSAKDAETNYGIIAVATGQNSTNIGIKATASGLDSYAGEFIGDVSVSDDLIVLDDATITSDLTVEDDLDVTDLTSTSRLKVGPGTTSYFKSMQGGTFVVGADNTAGDQAPADGIKVISVTFPSSFPTTPKIIVTSSTQTGATFNDAFSVTTRSVTTTGCVLIIKRLDSDYEWAQNLRVDWFGFSF